MSDKQGMEGSLAFTIDEIAEALKYIPAPLDELEGVQNAAPVSPILENAKPKTIEKAKAKAITKIAIINIYCVRSIAVSQFLGLFGS